MQTVNITAHHEDTSQLEAIKAVMKSLKIKFEISDDSSYSPEFVAKIERSRKDYLEGKGTVVTLDDLKDLGK